MIDELRELLRYKDLLKQLVIRDLKVRYKNSILGFFWSLVNPLVQVATITVVVKYIMRLDIPNYSAYLLVGYLPLVFFQMALLDSVSVVDASRPAAESLLPARGAADIGGDREPYPFPARAADILRLSYVLSSLPTRRADHEDRPHAARANRDTDDADSGPHVLRIVPERVLRGHEIHTDRRAERALLPDPGDVCHRTRVYKDTRGLARAAV